MAGIVSKTYGHALFELALEQNSIDTLREEANLVLEVLKETPELQNFYEHPKITMEEKETLTKECFLGRVSDSMTGFLLIIVTNGRQKDLPRILADFEAEVKEYYHIGVAKVTSALALPEEQKKALVTRLLETTKYSSFDVEYKVDPTLIGGIVIQIGDRVMDSSIRTQLTSMAKELAQVQLS